MSTLCCRLTLVPLSTFEDGETEAQRGEVTCSNFLVTVVTRKHCAELSVALCILLLWELTLYISEDLKYLWLPASVVCIENHILFLCMGEKATRSVY